MKKLSEQDILNIWEQGRYQYTEERALTILEQIFPDHSRKELAKLPVGRRDELLFAARVQTFGRQFVCLVTCPACGERLEFTFAAEDLGIELYPRDENLRLSSEIRQLYKEGYNVEYSLLTSEDLNNVCLQDKEPEILRIELARSCIYRAALTGCEVPVEELPDLVIVALAAEMDINDPHGIIEFDMNCPACKMTWQSLFDVARYYWNEIEVHARCLLREIHALARTYGWTEPETLALSASRRQIYLEMVTDE